LKQTGPSEFKHQANRSDVDRTKKSAGLRIPPFSTIVWAPIIVARRIIVEAPIIVTATTSAPSPIVIAIQIIVVAPTYRNALKSQRAGSDGKDAGIRITPDPPDRAAIAYYHNGGVDDQAVGIGGLNCLHAICR
jgi:hypothetical protein